MLLKGIPDAAVVPEGILDDPLADEADEEDAFLEKVYEDKTPVSAGIFPEGNADPMSKMFFCWLCPLLCKGYKVAHPTNQSARRDTRLTNQSAPTGDMTSPACLLPPRQNRTPMPIKPPNNMTTSSAPFQKPLQYSDVWELAPDDRTNRVLIRFNKTCA